MITLKQGIAILCITLGAGAVRPAYADGTYVKFGPGGVMPMRNTEIQMVRERVELSVRRKHLLADDSKVFVKVTYLFRNHTTKKLRVHMGFPVGLDFREQYIQEEGHFGRDRPDAISHLVATVSGKRVRVRLVPSRKRVKFPENKLLQDGIIFRGDQAIQNNPPLFDRYHVWAVTFGPKQDRIVVNQFIYDASAKIYVDQNDLRYILRTGAAWQGKIEEATIRLRLGDRGCVSGEKERDCFDLAGFHLKGFEYDDAKAKHWASHLFRPKGDQFKGITPCKPQRRVASDGRVEFLWSLKNFEPSKDLHLFYGTARGARQAIRKAIARATKRTHDRRLLREARDTLLALYGIVSKDAKVQRRMATKSWYVPVPAMTRARLPKDKVLIHIEAALRRSAALRRH